MKKKFSDQVFIANQEQINDFHHVRNSFPSCNKTWINIHHWGGKGTRGESHLVGKWPKNSFSFYNIAWLIFAQLFKEKKSEKNREKCFHVELKKEREKKKKGSKKKVSWWGQQAKAKAKSSREFFFSSWKKKTKWASNWKHDE